MRLLMRKLRRTKLNENVEAAFDALVDARVEALDNDLVAAEDADLAADVADDDLPGSTPQRDDTETVSLRRLKPPKVF